MLAVEVGKMAEENLGDQPSASDRLNEAFALEAKAEYEAALSACDAAIEMGRSFLAEAYNLRGLLLEELGQSEDAIGAYERALGMDPDLEPAALNLQELEKELGIGHTPVTVAKFGSVLEASIAKGLLETEGIWAFVPDEHVTTPLPTERVIGGIRLQVRESDLATALEILDLAQEDEDDWRCPDSVDPILWA
jgi:tetratricopeptide (TPR) repeat protein